jgi:hypothetical protein
MQAESQNTNTATPVAVSAATFEAGTGLLIKAAIAARTAIAIQKTREAAAAIVRAKIGFKEPRDDISPPATRHIPETRNATGGAPAFQYELEQILQVWPSILLQYPR